MRHQIIIIGFLVATLPGVSFSQQNRDNEHFVGMFDGRTPCRELSIQLNETVRDECTKIKWRLKLYRDPTQLETGRYELQGFVYKKENPRIGKWQIEKGTKANPDARVYRLEQEGRPTIFLQQLDENILFFLDEKKNLLVGNRDFSYTLNRVK
jgi:hypothetical protein